MRFLHYTMRFMLLFLYWWFLECHYTITFFSLKQNQVVFCCYIICEPLLRGLDWTLIYKWIKQMIYILYPSKSSSTMADWKLAKTAYHNSFPHQQSLTMDCVNDHIKLDLCGSIWRVLRWSMGERCTRNTCGYGFVFLHATQLALPRDIGQHDTKEPSKMCNIREGWGSIGLFSLCNRRENREAFLQMQSFFNSHSIIICP